MRMIVKSALKVAVLGAVAGICISIAWNMHPLGRRGESLPVSISSWILGEDDTFRPKPNAMPKPDKTYDVEVWVSMPKIPPQKRDQLKVWVTGICSGVNTDFARIRTVIRYIDEDNLPKKLIQRTKSGSPPDLVAFSPANFGDYGIYQLPLQSFLTEDEQSRIFANAKEAVTGKDKGWLLGWPLGIRMTLWAVHTEGMKRSGMDPIPWATGQYSTDKLVGQAKNAGYRSLTAIGIPNADLGLDLSVSDKESSDALYSGISQDPLAGFLNGRSLSLAPITPVLADILGGGEIVLLPTPGKSTGSVSAVSVFRGNRRHFKGFEQLRVCVELARRMSEQAASPGGPVAVQYLAPAQSGLQPAQALSYLYEAAPRAICKGPLPAKTVIRTGKALRKAISAVDEPKELSVESLQGFSESLSRTYGP